MQPSPTSPQPTLSPELPAPDRQPETPIADTPPKGANILLPKALVDDLYREARKNFALIPDMTFALAAGARSLRDMWEHKDGKFQRKERPFANYIPPSESESATSTQNANADRVGRARTSLDAALEPPDEPDAQTPSHGHAESQRPDGVESDADELTQLPEDMHDALIDDARLLNVHASGRSLSAGVSSIPAVAAAVTANGTLTGVKIEAPGSQYWGPTNKQAASAVLGRIAAVGDAIQKHGTAEQKEAWKQLKRIILDDNPASMSGVAQNEGDTLRVDLSRMGAGANTKKAPDPNFVMFMLVHEIFHSAKSDRAAQAAARKMQGGQAQKQVPKIGTPQWSAEVRLDKRVYDFLVTTGLLGNPPPPIQTIAPYYYEHLKNPQVPVHLFPGVPGYDQPLT